MLGAYVRQLVGVRPPGTTRHTSPRNAARLCQNSSPGNRATVPPWVPAASTWLSGLNATLWTVVFALAESGASWVWLAVFHSSTVPSLVPAARVRPSGLNATLRIGLSAPADSEASRVCLAAFHSRTVPSLVPAAR